MSKPAFRPLGMAARLATATIVLALAAAGGCTQPCEQLAVEVCVCWDGEESRNACETYAAYRMATTPPTEEQRVRCNQVISAGTCDCNAALAHDAEACGSVSIETNQPNSP